MGQHLSDKDKRIKQLEKENNELLDGVIKQEHRINILESTFEKKIVLTAGILYRYGCIVVLSKEADETCLTTLKRVIREHGYDSEEAKAIVPCIRCVTLRAMGFKREPCVQCGSTGAAHKTVDAKKFHPVVVFGTVSHVDCADPLHCACNCKGACNRTGSSNSGG